jgi:hypothetical protein
MATEKPKVTIVSVVDTPSNEPGRAGKNDAFITYRYDALHTYTIKIPAEGLTPDKVDALVRTDFAQRKPLINREITVG